jgi:ATPase
MSKKIVLDTSIIIDRKIHEIIEKEKPEEIIIPNIVLDELQAQASKGRDEGYLGLEQLKETRKICQEKQIKLSFKGERPTLNDIKLASSGRLDALIRDTAKKNDATLMTADYVQSLVGEAEGVKTKYILKKKKTIKLGLQKTQCLFT